MKWIWKRLQNVWHFVWSSHCCETHPIAFLFGDAFYSRYRMYWKLYFTLNGNCIPQGLTSYWHAVTVDIKNMVPWRACDMWTPLLTCLSTAGDDWDDLQWPTQGWCVTERRKFLDYPNAYWYLTFLDPVSIKRWELLIFVDCSGDSFTGKTTYLYWMVLKRKHSRGPSQYKDVILTL